MSRKKNNQFEFRIIAGQLRGVRITAPDLGVTRPPLTRLRKSICDFLQPYLDGACYLDLFSGTGSYLFEVVSRGVAEAVGIEQEPRLVTAINDQARRLEIGKQLICMCDDVFEAVPRLDRAGKQFDIIMIAPPQYQGLIDRTLLLIADTSLLNDNGLIICQHDSTETADINFAGFPILQQRKYGNTTFTVLGIG